LASFIPHRVAQQETGEKRRKTNGIQLRGAIPRATITVTIPEYRRSNPLHRRKRVVTAITFAAAERWRRHDRVTLAG
jgi:hypothetical protein